MSVTVLNLIHVISVARDILVPFLDILLKVEFNALDENQ